MKKNLNIFLQDLLQSLRHLRRTGWQTAVSVLGLVVGLVSLTLSLNWLWTETHYDRFRPDYKELYQLQVRYEEGDGPHFAWLHCQEIKSALEGSGAQAAVYQGSWGRTKHSVPDKPEKMDFCCTIQADTALISVLGLKPLAGSLEALFAEGEHVVLTRSVAERLFTSPELAIGKSVVSTSLWGENYYKVVGVVEDCEEESNIYYDCLRKLPPAEGRELQYNTRNYRLLIRTSDVEHTQTLLPLLRMNGAEGDTLRFVQKPLRKLHSMPGEAFSILDVYFYRLTFIGISALLLLSALVNLLIFFTCLFLGRTREYALRRSLGSSVWQNALWMLTDLLPTLVAATLLGAVALEWLGYGDYVPGFEDHVLTVYGWVLAGTGVVLLLLLLYPLTRMRRIYRRSFAGTASPSASHSYLLVVQCFCCALLLFLSLGMQRQIKGMLTADLGFERENILRLYTGNNNVYEEDDKQSYESFAHDIPDELCKEVGAGITDAILMPADIFNRVSRYSGVVVPEEVMHREERENAGGNIWAFYQQSELRGYDGIGYVEIPYDALHFFGLTTRHGHGFSTEGLAAGEWPAMVNGRALERLGLHFPAEDKLYLRGTSMNVNSVMIPSRENHYHNSVVRVQDVLDVCLMDFYSEDLPVVFIGVPPRHTCAMVQNDAVYIKYAPGRRDEAEASVRRVLTQKFNVDSEKICLDDMESHIAFTYEKEIYYANLLTAVTVFSVFITFSGVLSLLLYSLRLRRRQMAIRRVMGADFGEVLRTTLPPYLLYTLLGGLLAYAPAAYFMRKWMGYFHYGSAPGTGFMAAIVGGMLLVVFLLTWWQVRRAMKEKPVDVLRPEA